MCRTPGASLGFCSLNHVRRFGCSWQWRGSSPGARASPRRARQRPEPRALLQGRVHKCASALPLRYDEAAQRFSARSQASCAALAGDRRGAKERGGKLFTTSFPGHCGYLGYAELLYGPLFLEAPAGLHASSCQARTLQTTSASTSATRTSSPTPTSF